MKNENESNLREQSKSSLRELSGSSLRELSNEHEKLCAYVLGEGTPAERADLEREMLRSPALRAEHDRVAATLACVSEALKGSETLSPAATHAVAAAANVSRPGAWQAVPWMRIAAGLGAVALGLTLVYRANDARTTETAGNLEVARFDDASKSAARIVAPKDEAARGRDSVPATATPNASKPAGNVGFLGAPADTSSKGKTGAIDGEEKLVSAFDRAGAADERKKLEELIVQEARLGSAPTEAKNNALDQVVESLEKAPGSKAPVTTWSERDQLAGRGVVDLAPNARPSGGVVEGPRARGSSTTPGSVDAPARLPVNQEPKSTVGVVTKADAGLYGGVAPAGPTAGGVSTGQGAAPEQRIIGLDAKEGSKDRSHLSGGTFPPPPSTAPAPTAGFPGGGGRVELGREVTRRLSDAGDSASTSAAPSEAKPGELMDFDAGDADKFFTEEAKKRAKEPRGQLTSIGYFGEAEDDRTPPIPYYRLAPAEQQIYLDRECRRILVDCRPRPNERPRDMYFRFWGDNPFEVAALDAQSTFAADVDTASYALARRYVNEGNVPEKAQIRTEEFVNYFKADVPAPTSGVFGIHTNLTPSRFSTDTSRQMMRVVVRGKDLSKVERKPMNLTFVVDVSGSMREQNRLEMVKHAMRLLVTQLDQYDRIAIVKFSTDAQRVLDLTPVRDRAAIESAIMPLAPEGSTNSNAGLELGYGIAVAGFDPNATNRVVFLSDGVANVGETDPNKIAERVKPMREKGIYLNTIGVGMNNHNDVLLEQLADKADGMCAYIDTPDEAKKQLVDNFSGAFQPIARDVKIQVEFDPRQVLRYRLLGYENRAIADADFRNDKVDAGELGAGHTVTALYEVERQSGAAADGPLATVRLRWKDPSTFGLPSERDTASEMAHTVLATQATSFEGAGASYRKAVMAGQFAELLRRSVHARGDSVDDLLNEAVKLQKEIPNDTEFAEFVLLVSKAKDAILRTMPVCDELCQAVDQVREFEYRRQQLASLQRELDQKTLDELRQQNDLLEARLREVLRRRLESQGR